MNYIAVQGCELEFVNPAHSGDIKIETTPSQKVLADGKGVYHGTLQITIANFTGGDITVSKSGATVTPGTLNGGSTTTKAEGDPVVLQGDTSEDITVVGLKPQGNTTVTATATTKVKIKKAGQTKAKAE